jgi:hypothetical protein
MTLQQAHQSQRTDSALPFQIQIQQVDTKTLGPQPLSENADLVQADHRRGVGAARDGHVGDQPLPSADLQGFN